MSTAVFIFVCPSLTFDYFYVHRKMMTLKRGICQSTEDPLHQSTSPKWTLPNPKSFWRCLRRERPWWFLQRCPETPQRRRQRRSPACGRAASSMPTLMYRGTVFRGGCRTVNHRVTLFVLMLRCLGLNFFYVVLKFTDFHELICIFFCLPLKEK